jgi:hypothetical protein
MTGMANSRTVRLATFGGDPLAAVWQLFVEHIEPIDWRSYIDLAAVV